MIPLEMGAEEKRRLGYAVVDALVRRSEELRASPPWGGATRAELEELLGEPAPEKGSDPHEVLERAWRDVFPYAGRIDHPRFFAFVPASPTWPSVVADFLTAGLSIFQGTWLESAGPSEVELVVVDWFREWLGYPEGAGGLFTSGGSAANLCALVAARERAGNPSDPVVYVSNQGHSSLERAARIAGVPTERVRKLPVDHAFRLDPRSLEEALEEDCARGWTPVAVCASAGATNTGAVDPLGSVADLCEEHGTWMHVDAAYGGFAVLTERGRVAFDGISRADSVTLDPHKWLFQPYEAGCLVARDVRTLEDAFHILPEYLQDTELGYEHVNFADRGLQLTRSFRAFKVWFSVQTFGLGAFRDAIDRSIDIAFGAAERLLGSEVLELLAPPSLGIVCFRFAPLVAIDEGGRKTYDRDEEALEELNEEIQERIVEEGTAMMSSTRLHGRYSLRLCVLNYRSTADDVDAVLDRIEEIGWDMARS